MMCCAGRLSSCWGITACAAVSEASWLSTRMSAARLRSYMSCSIATTFSYACTSSQLHYGLCQAAC